MVISTLMDALGGYPLVNCPYADSALPPIVIVGNKTVKDSLIWSLTAPHTVMIHDSVSSQNSTGLVLQLHNPTISLTFLLVSVTGWVLALWTLARYQGVKVFNRSVKDPSVHHGAYIAYFLFMALGFFIDSVRYMVDLPHGLTFSLEKNKAMERTIHHEKEAAMDPRFIDDVLLITSAISRAIAAFCLSVAMNQQRQYRSGVYGLSMFCTTSNEDRASSSFSRSQSQSPAPFHTLARPPSISSSRTHSQSLIHSANHNTPLPPSDSVTSPVASIARPPNTFLNYSIFSKLRSRNASEEGRRLLDDEESMAENEFEQESNAGCPNSLTCYTFWDRLYSYFGNWNPCFFLLFCFRCLSIYLVSRPTFSHHPEDTTPSGALVQLSILAGILQHVPIACITYFILMEPLQEGVVHRHRRTRRRYGVRWSSKFCLLLAVLSSMAWWLEPSILSRLYLMFLDPKEVPQNALCTLPPLWWPHERNPDNNITGLPSVSFGLSTHHGWASYLDAFQWVGWCSIILIFVFARSEYLRVKEEWVRVIVHQVQNQFDWNRE